MPIHLPFQVPRIPDFLKRPLDPNQTLEAFEHYAKEAIEFATKHGGEIGRNIMDDLVDLATPYAAALDIGVDALLPGFNLWYGEKWAQRQGKRKNPFKMSGVIKRPKPNSGSLSPAHGMPYLPYPRTQLAATGRGFKSRKKRTRKPDTKSVKLTFDDNGRFGANHVLYLTQHDYGSMSRALQMGIQALLRAALSQVYVYPAGYNLVLDMPSDATHLVVYFRQIENQTIAMADGHETEAQVTDTNRVFLINGKTFKDAAEDMYETSTVANQGMQYMSKNGYYPYAFKWRKDGGDQGTGKYRELGDSTITYKAMTVMRLQNQSVGDNASTSTDNVYTNPIRGKIYYTRGPTPLVRDALLENGLDNYDQFQRHGATDDPLSKDAAGIHVPVVVTSEQSELNHPPNGRTLFKNCYGERNINIGAGKILTFKTTFKKTLRVSEFFKSIMSDHDELTRLHKRNDFGKCTTIALEHSLRGRSHLDGGAPDEVQVGVNRELFLSAYVKLRTRVPMLSGYQNTHVGIDHS